MRKFNTAINGYDKQEVNQFVSEVTNEYEQMLEKLKSKDKEIALLEEQVDNILQVSISERIALGGKNIKSVLYALCTVEESIFSSLLSSISTATITLAI